MAITIENGFTLDMAPDAAWALLNDIERIAPCVPGAQLTEIAGDDYHGTVKVKLGPITAQYKGVATITARDAAARRLTLTGKGRDMRGVGTAGADLVMEVTGDGAGSRVALVTDLALTGKVAQLGRGVMQDVSSRLIDQFVTNLKALESPSVLTNEPAWADMTAQANAPEPAVTAAPLPVATATDPIASRRIDSPPAEAVDLMKLGGATFGRELIVGAWMAAVLIVLVLILLKHG